jgi:hypothetical protein
MKIRTGFCALALALSCVPAWAENPPNPPWGQAPAGKRMLVEWFGCSPGGNCEVTCDGRSFKPLGWAAVYVYTNDPYHLWMESGQPGSALGSLYLIGGGVCDFSKMTRILPLN